MYYGCKMTEVFSKAFTAQLIHTISVTIIAGIETPSNTQEDIKMTEVSYEVPPSRIKMTENVSYEVPPSKIKMTENEAYSTVPNGT